MGAWLDDNFGIAVFLFGLALLLVGLALFLVVPVIHLRRTALESRAVRLALEGSSEEALRLAGRIGGRRTSSYRNMEQRIRELVHFVEYWLKVPPGTAVAAPVPSWLASSHVLMIALLNKMICAAVTNGRYREALGAELLFPEAVRLKARRKDPHTYAIACINRAEALHNLGRDQEALDALEQVEKDVQDNPLGKSGLLCLRAWILVRVRDPDGARRALEDLDPAPLADYAAELSYTWSALEREVGRADAALAAARRGLSLATLPSSIRNGHVMVASALALAGDLDAARAAFDQARAHPHRGQSGDGLLRHGELLERLGDEEGARGAYQLAIEEDPQSVFAAEAQRRLATTTYSNRTA